jgi:DNA-binding CsgD family transcriptional regulator
MQEKNILDLVAAIGAVPDINEVRRVTLEMIRELIWFDGATFWLIEPLTGLLQTPPVSLDMPPKGLAYYLEHYLYSDEVYLAYKNSNLLIACITDFLDFRRWTQQSEMYDALYRTYGLHYQLGCEIREGQQVFGAMSLFRSKSTGNFCLQDIKILYLLYPHLLNRLRWHHTLEAARRRFWTSQRPHDRVASGHPFGLLTGREWGVVQLVLSGAANREIAEKLDITANTVKMHMRNVFTKLGIKRRSQLLAFYLAAGITSDDE